MGNGGIIPTSKIQTVTFYNTAGIIERGKNMYLVPLFSKTLALVGQKVSVAYLNEFKRVCPPFSDYSDMEISGWLPTDRTLIVNGNIDDFKLVTEVGNSLNYLIITRQITTNNVTKTYYYAFFITAVNQAGKNSVRISIEPDDFTDVYYLHNVHILSASDISGNYEPFNEKMKNCYVNRQHYNRVKTGDTAYILEIKLTDMATRPELEVGDTITLDLEGAEDSITGELTYVDDQTERELGIHIRTSERVEIEAPQNISFLYYDGISYRCDYSLNDVRWRNITPLEEDNLTIFLNQEESFKFKYQYRDYRGDMPFISVEEITPEDLESIKIKETWNSLSAKEKSIVIRNSLSYYVLEMKSIDSISEVLFSVLDDIPRTSFKLLSCEFINKFVRRTSPLCVVPFIDIPEDFRKTGYNPSLIFKFNFADGAVREWNLNDVWVDNQQVGYINWFIQQLHKNNMDEEISSMYMTKNISLNYFCAYNTTNQTIVVSIDLPNDFLSSTGNRQVHAEYNHIYPVGIISNKSVQSPQVDIYEEYVGPTSNPKFMLNSESSALPALIISKELEETMIIKFNKSVDYDLTNVYYDPVLEAEPYSFYSLSYQANELPLNKARYYATSEVEFEVFSAFNGMAVYAFIPNYTVQDYKTRYINEALSFTTTEFLPLVTDAYLSFYYRNMSQMKNQFAVNNYNRGMDLLQHFFISGPAQVARGGARGGTAGAMSALIGEVADMHNEAIDWAQSDKVIDMNQKAKLADMGKTPDTLSQSGTEVYSSIIKNEYSLKLNHYRIDSLSHDSIAKYLERFGYSVKLYSDLHVVDRVGWNFLQLVSFDWNPNVNIMASQQESIKQIFTEGVTLLHDKAYLTSGHNYETILE